MSDPLLKALEKASWKMRQKTDPNKLQRIYVSEVVRAVAKEFEVTPAQIAGESRRNEICLARHVAIYLASRVSIASITGIGRAIGDRDHSTACNSLKRIPKLFAADPKLKLRVERVEQQLLDSKSAPQESSAPPEPTPPHSESGGATIPE